MPLGEGSQLIKNKLEKMKGDARRIEQAIDIFIEAIKNDGNSGTLQFLKEIRDFFNKFKEGHDIDKNWNDFLRYVEAIEKRNNSLESHSSIVEKSYYEAENSLSFFESKCSELRSQLEERDGEIKRLKVDFKEYKDRCEKLDRELRNLRGEKEDEIKDL